jgi:hypothetical protein
MPTADYSHSSRWAASDTSAATGSTSTTKAPFGAPVTEGLYGAFNYTPEKDVARAPMRVDALPYRLEQLTWEFTDMTATGGRMSMLWDRTMASVPFTFGR